MVGPRTQEDLFSILIRSRKHKYVIIADAEKMYRQIKLIPEHRDYQRMLWRFEEKDPILEYRITTVIDGTASSSFIATRVLQQLADDQEKTFPEASKVIKEDFYMDDMSTGSYSIENTTKLQNDIIQVMGYGKFNMRKWLSNSKEILENVPIENRQDPATLIELSDNSVKTLGVYWNPLEDSFEFKIRSCSTKKNLTKRELLSDISQLFDPIGWLAPCTVMAKIFMQSLWMIKNLEWDSKVPEESMKVWRQYREELHFLENIKIPRWIGTNEIVRMQLHGFGDASDAAYAAVIFSRLVKSDGSIEVRNLTAKTKVSPIKTISTPKLELCGSVILSRLLNKVKESLKLPDIETFAYCDNTTVLAWISSEPNSFNVFVANRITEIQNLTKNTNWSFVSTVENPADCASRGIYPSELVGHKLWWQGPEWLAKYQSNWPSYESVYETNLEKKKIPSHTFHIKVHPQDEYLVTIMKRHSTLSRLLWNTAYVTKYCTTAKLEPRKKVDTPNAHDLNVALVKWTKYVQYTSFKEDIDRIKAGEELLMRSKLIKLRPFIDNDGLLRVGGRLSKSELVFSAKHPIILPKKNYFTKLIIERAHKYTLHGGPTSMSSFLQNYWIFCRSTEIKNVVRTCVQCFPHRCKPAGQIMADLPASRVTQSRSFLHTGLDLAGPIITKTYTGRSRGIHSNPTQKSYICIFVCMATKAIHIELISDTSAASFIAGFKRFVSRRGKCTDLYSDNGKNFIGARNELRHQFSMLMRNTELQSYLAHDGVTWHFNPPLSPNFGGLWEAGVKSIKYHLKRLAGNMKFTFEELTTLLCQIEACLNSRPLCAVSDNINDTSYLTPGHFLIGDAPISVPEMSLLDINSNRLSRWKVVQQTYQQFWSIWHKEYLSRLHNRPKWVKPQENIRVGQLVLLRDENTPPTKWPVARITKVHPDEEGYVRVVTLEKHRTKITPPIPRDFAKYLA